MSLALRPAVPSNLKISSPLPPTYLSAVSAPMSLIIRNEPLLTAEPSIVVTPAPVLDVIVIDVEPKTIHRIEAVTDLTLYETSTPHLDDVIRLQDDKSRESGLIQYEHSKT